MPAFSRLSGHQICNMPKQKPQFFSVFTVASKPCALRGVSIVGTQKKIGRNKKGGGFRQQFLVKKGGLCRIVQMYVEDRGSEVFCSPPVSVRWTAAFEQRLGPWGSPP